MINQCRSSVYKNISICSLFFVNAAYFGKELREHAPGAHCGGIFRGKRRESEGSTRYVSYLANITKSAEVTSRLESSLLSYRKFAVDIR